MIKLDISKFPDIQYGHVFFALDADAKIKLSKLPQTLARAEGAISFSLAINGSKELVKGVEDPDITRKRESKLRASLAEYVSMEEALERDLQNTGIGTSVLKINQSQNPLLHIMRELRNLEIHLNSSTLASVKKDYIWKVDGDEVPFTGNVWYIDNLVDSSLLKLRNSKYYDPTELKNATAKFLKIQKEWGLSELLLRTIKEYCDNIISHYKL